MYPNLIYKNRPLIYAIVNKVNGKIYVGKTKCAYRRCHQYIYDFKSRAIGHINDYLYASMLKYGIDSFEMFALEFCNIDELSDKELKWMDHLQTNDRDFGYNLRRDSSTGMITSPETSSKISENLKRQWREGLRSGHGEKLKDNWRNNDDRKRKQSELFRGVKTKYKYLITKPNGETVEGAYRDLVKMGLTGVMTSFSKYKTNEYKCKGHLIKKVQL